LTALANDGAGKIYYTTYKTFSAVYILLMIRVKNHRII